MRIAMVGTRGVPARYGGFETAVEEIGRRLVERGHHVTVYSRGKDPDVGQTYLGMERIVLPALRYKALETLSHTFLSSLDAFRRPPFEAVFLFNAANVLLLPILRRRGTSLAIHVDGLESLRSKWGPLGRGYYRMSESLAVRWADALIADSDSIGEYYQDEFGATTEQIAYGAPVLYDIDADGLEAFGIEPGSYHLVVARFEPENHVRLIVEGYRQSGARWPLLVVGGAPYAPGYVASLYAAAAQDERVRLVGPVWDQALLDRLYHHAGTYVHGHSVGGTNPSLLRAMGAGAPVLAYDVVFAREVLADTGWYFRNADELRELLVAAEANPVQNLNRGSASRRVVETEYRWDQVVVAYENLAGRMTGGETRRRQVTGRRNPQSPWKSPEYLVRRGSAQ